MILLWIELKEHFISIDQTGHLSRFHDATDQGTSIQTTLKPIDRNGLGN